MSDFEMFQFEYHIFLLIFTLIVQNIRMEQQMVLNELQNKIQSCINKCLKVKINIKTQIMSKPNQKFASTFYNQERKKQVRTPPKNESAMKRTQKSYDFKKRITDNQTFQDIVLHQKDQRFKYLIKNGQLKRIQKSGNIIFAELPQIPNVWVCYRRPIQREANLEKLNLDSLDLTHVPLLQGEQKLKMITFQHNKINKIENLISLPNLLYIDLYDNLIKEMENLALPTLKVLLLPKNQISRIRGINELTKLQVLDLHNNKISRIEGVGSLQNLRILNLSHNEISRIENIQLLSGLNEVNLKSNLISAVENVGKLINLQKLYLASNRIEIKNFETSELTKLQSLKQLSLENNPVCKDKNSYVKGVIKHLSWVKMLDGKTPTLQQEEHKLQSSDSESNHQQVLSLISSQWQEQKNRIRQIELNNGNKREYLKNTCITGGHAEIQDQNILFIYGNSYDVVLTNPTFQETVQKIRIQYVFIEFLIESNILNILKKFKKLKILEFRQTYIMSLLQIAKLQNVSNLKIINIEPQGNPISSCTFLKQFIIYRFPAVIQINREDIKETDRAKAKALFQNFDKVLQIPEKVYGIEMMRLYPSQDINSKKDKNYIKMFNKTINEAADQIINKVTEKTESNLLVKQSLEKMFDMAMMQLIKKTKMRHGG